MRFLSNDDLKAQKWNWLIVISIVEVDDGFFCESSPLLSLSSLWSFENQVQFSDASSITCNLKPSWINQQTVNFRSRLKCLNRLVFYHEFHRASKLQVLIHTEFLDYQFTSLGLTEGFFLAQRNQERAWSQIFFKICSNLLILMSEIVPHHIWGLHSHWGLEWAPLTFYY